MKKEEFLQEALATPPGPPHATTVANAILTSRKIVEGFASSPEGRTPVVNGEITYANGLPFFFLGTLYRWFIDSM
jgi:hypothetical protein